MMPGFVIMLIKFRHWSASLSREEELVELEARWETILLIVENYEKDTKIFSEYIFIGCFKLDVSINIIISNIIEPPFS